MPRKRIAILGGGITGLVAAYDLERLTDAEIDLYEASNRLGGKIGTDRVGDLTVEAGPDCFFARKPEIVDLVCELGLESEAIEPRQKEFAMLVGGTLHRVPNGLVSFTGVQAEAVRRTPFLGEEAKRRVLSERAQPAGNGDDESIRSFFTRRFGGEFSRLVAEPLLAGTHSGDPGRLSMRALFPAYLETERKFGSLAAAELPPPSGKATFLSFKGGMNTLVQGVTKGLSRTRVHLGVRPESVEALEADRVLIALPANAAASLVSSPVAEKLGRIKHCSSAIASLAFPRERIVDPLDTTGFLVPPGEHPLITGATFSSRKWEGRAPEDAVLIRVFLGGDRSRFAERTNAQLAEEAVTSIRPLLGIESEPLLGRVDKWIDALPQYEIGHLDLLAEIDAAMAEFPHLYLAGTSYRGVGVPDCVRQAREISKKIAERL